MRSENEILDKIQLLKKILDQTATIEYRAFLTAEIQALQWVVGEDKKLVS